MRAGSRREVVGGGDGDQLRHGLLDRVSYPAVARQRAEDEHRHAAGRGQAESVPAQPGQEAAGGGELRHPDELVAAPWDAEMGGGLPHPRLAQHFDQAWHDADRGQQQRERDEHRILPGLEHCAEVAGSIS
jgi:hypothetical protein